MAESNIEWTDVTWNPIVGCSIVSPGCTNCYAMKMAARIEAMGSAPHYAGLTKRVKGDAVWTGKLALAPERILLEPLRRKKPTTYFVNSMGDLFHEDVPEDWIRAVYATMARTPHHTYQVLTKRARRMRDILLKWEAAGLTLREGRGVVLPNVWLGVSAERQQEADERIPDLLDTPAAIRFVSAEPLIGPIDFTSIGVRDAVGGAMRLDAFVGLVRDLAGYKPRQAENMPAIDWVVVGGESGHGARPFDVAWARSILNQCKTAGVACFVKQLGANVCGVPFPGTGISNPKWKLASKKGGDPSEWSADLRVRDFPRC